MASRSGSRLSASDALLFQGGIGVVGLVLVLLFSIPLQFHGLGWFQALLWGCLGAAGTYGLLLLLTLIPGLFPDSMGRQMANLHDFASGFSWPVLLALSALAGAGEELLFRGAIQGWVSGVEGTVTGVVVSSLLFGLVHWVSFTYFLVTAGLGLLFGSVYALTDSLLLVMVWHGVYDVIALYCLLRFPQLFGLPPRRIY